MFRKTLSLWQRLVTRPKEHLDTDTAVKDERRLWVRYAGDTDARVEVAANQGGQRVGARVSDISLGGAKLIVERAFEPGELITLELPGCPEQARTVLACVVRSLPRKDGQWSVGCIFARELTEGELASVGVPDGDQEEDDQRLTRRFDCNLEAHYQVLGGAERPSQAAQVLNISSSGVGLLVRDPLEAGSLLSLDLFDGQGRLVRSILACVVHTMARTDGNHAVGCNFIRELAEDELEAVI